MEEETNNIVPGDSENNMSTPLDIHLNAIMRETELTNFHKQLPPDFLSDATEGLHLVNDTKQLEFVLQRLNHQLHQHLKHKKILKRTHRIGNLSWTYWAIIIVLLLAMIGFFIVRMLLHH